MGHTPLRLLHRRHFAGTDDTLLLILLVHFYFVVGTVFKSSAYDTALQILVASLLHVTQVPATDFFHNQRLSDSSPTL